MRILHIIPSLSPRSGGPTTVVRALSHYQESSGLDVTVCTTNWGISLRGPKPSAGYIEVQDNSVRFLYFTYLTPLLMSPAMAKWIDKRLGDFDIVHIHGLYRFPVTYAAWRAQRAGVPYVISPHGSLDPFLYKQSRYNLPLKRIYERLFDIPNLNHAAAIHYTAEEEAERAAFLGLRAKPVIVPIGIDWESYKQIPARGHFRRRLGLDVHTPLVLFLGRINFKKGLDLLVPAFSHVVHQRPGARLAIVGPDNEDYGSKVKLWCREQGIEDKVFFVDHLGPEEVKQAYVDADVFVLPSYTENFGMTVVEAMACGCPVVISDQVNIWREIQQERAGLVVTLHPLELAEAVCHVLAHKEEAKAMGARGRKAAEIRYAWHRIVDQLTQIYRGLIEEAASKRLPQD